MKGSNKVRWCCRLLPVLLVMFLLAGMFSLMAPAATYAIGSNDEVKTDCITAAESATMEVLYDGTVALAADETFTVTAYNSDNKYTVDWNTPLGVLQAAANAGGFTYEVTDKNYEKSGALLLDNVGDYLYVKKGSQWYAYVNDVYKDGFNNAAGALNLIKLSDGNRVEFYYADGIADETDLNAVKAAATAAVKTVVDTDAIPTDWVLQLSGAKDVTITKAEFEEALACASSSHRVSWTDGDGNVWSGVSLWVLLGAVDDIETGSHWTFNDTLAANYSVKVAAEDGFSKTFAGTDLARSEKYIIANKCNGEVLTDSWPLRLVGPGVTKDGSLGGASVGSIVAIELANLGAAPTIPELCIFKYAGDGTTILQEKTVDYQWMEKKLEVIGDGETVYRFEGITFDPNDIWGECETYPGGFKIENVVKGTRIKDICDLVGGMGAGTEIVLVAKDGFETRLPYSSIYADPAVQGRQGDAFLAWWSDGEYAPDYVGMRLFFTAPEDHVYGQWDMHETLPENYWRYHYSDGVQYPSCAGLSAKYITEIKVYSIPQGDWTLELDGRDIGGLECDVSKTYFEQALACQFGAEHKATYTDSKGRTWEGMPLWFLAGFVDDANQHSDNAFNDALAKDGYQVKIIAADGYSVTIDSADIIRNSDYIVANTLDGVPISESDDSWPLRLVGPAVSRSTSISQIARIELVSTERHSYGVEPVANDVYTIGETADGISTMTVNDDVSGFRCFTIGIEPVISHSGEETAVFTHLRNGVQLELNAIRADFDEVKTAQARFNIQAGDVIKAYIVDELTNKENVNPIVLQ